jgi:hypothetical protein
VTNDLVECGVGEPIELNLWDRPKPSYREADCDADDTRLGERCIKAPLLTKLVLQAIGDPEHATYPTDILSEHQDAFVFTERFAKRGVNGLHHR